ncbi:MAG: diguanylate cyclase [Acidimicrobiia bacterium]
MPERRSPVSVRFRRLAERVVEDACGHGGAWVVAHADGDELVAVAAAGPGEHPAPGERVHPDANASVVVPIAADGVTYGALLGSGVDAAAAQATLAHLRTLGDLLGAVAVAEYEAWAQADRAEEAARKVREVEVEALTDPLTGLSNRRGWDRALAAEERRRRRYGGSASVIVVDLDELKEINDTQGHLSGDLLLKLVARVIRETSRDSDFLARTGGDEFAVLALDCDEPQMHVLVARLRDALEREGAKASVGGASRRPSAGMAEAWAEADGMMFAEKTRRKG